MEEGVEVCFKKACLLIDSAIDLFQNHGSPDVVIGLTTIALGEFGKGLLLKDFLLVKKEQYQIAKDLFQAPLLIKLFNHASVNLRVDGNRMNVSVPKNLVKQFKNFNTDEVTFSSKYTPKIPNRANGLVNFPSRMLCFYVNWNDKEKNWETSRNF